MPDGARSLVLKRTDASPVNHYSVWDVAIHISTVPWPSQLLPEGNSVMPEADLIHLGSVRHLIQCPHCEKQAIQNWFGTMILYTAAKCKSCGKQFVIALNATHP